jgi:hypothetical protein
VDKATVGSVIAYSSPRTHSRSSEELDALVNGTEGLLRVDPARSRNTEWCLGGEDWGEEVLLI